MAGALDRLNAAVESVDDRPRQKSLGQQITELQDQLEAALPKAAGLTPERMARIALTSIRVNPKLAECTPQSFLGALMTSAQLGLELGGALGHAYPVPFRNNKKVNGGWQTTNEIQFIIGYKGMIELARRAGTHVETWVVHENDHFVYRRGDQATYEFEECIRGDRGAVLGYAVYARWVNGSYCRFMSVDDVEKVRDRSKGYDPAKPTGPWHTDFDAMARKTVVRAAFNSNEIPITVEIAQAINADETVRTSIDVNAIDEPRTYDSPHAGELPAANDADTDTVPEGEPFFGEPAAEQGQIVDVGESADREAAAGTEEPPGSSSPTSATTLNALLDTLEQLPDDIDSAAWLRDLSMDDIGLLADHYVVERPTNKTGRRLDPLATVIDGVRGRAA